MKFSFGIFIAMFLFVAGCAQNDTVTIEGKITGVNKEENSFVVYVGDTLTKKQRETMDIDKEEKVVEAFLSEATDDTVVKGKVKSFNDLKMGQKVSIEIKGDYKKELVTTDTFFDQKKLPTYKTEKITVIPYTKEDIVSEMTVSEGEYALYIYNRKPDENGAYTVPDIRKSVPIKEISMKAYSSEVRNEKELLGLFEDSTTYIITDDEGIVFKGKNEKELHDFIETLAKDETNKTQ